MNWMFVCVHINVCMLYCHYPIQSNPMCVLCITSFILLKARIETLLTHICMHCIYTSTHMHTHTFTHSHTVVVRTKVKDRGRALCCCCSASQFTYKKKFLYFVFFLLFLFSLSALCVRSILKICYCCASAFCFCSCEHSHTVWKPWALRWLLSSQSYSLMVCTSFQAGGDTHCVISVRIHSSNESEYHNTVVAEQKYTQSLYTHTMGTLWHVFTCVLLLKR